MDIHWIGSDCWTIYIIWRGIMSIKASRRRESDMIVVYLIDSYNVTYFEKRAWLKDKQSMREVFESLSIKGIKFHKDWFD